MKKRVFACLLALALTSFCIPVLAMNETETEIDIVRGYSVIRQCKGSGDLFAVNKAEEKQTVIITAAPRENSVLLSLTVQDNQGNAVTVTKTDGSHYTFVMPSCAVTVIAVFENVLSVSLDETGRVVYTVPSTLSKESVRLVAAQYRNGKMTGLFMQTLSDLPAEGTFPQAFAPLSGASYRFFLLGENGVPLCPFLTGNKD